MLRKNKKLKCLLGKKGKVICTYLRTIFFKRPEKIYGHEMYSLSGDHLRLFKKQFKEAQGEDIVVTPVPATVREAVLSEVACAMWSRVPCDRGSIELVWARGQFQALLPLVWAGLEGGVSDRGVFASGCQNIASPHGRTGHCIVTALATSHSLLKVNQNARDNRWPV